MSGLQLGGIGVLVALAGVAAACGNTATPAAPTESMRTGYTEELRGHTIFVNEGPAQGVRLTTRIRTVGADGRQVQTRSGPSTVTDAEGRFTLPAVEVTDLVDGTHFYSVSFVSPGASYVAPPASYVNRRLWATPRPAVDLEPLRFQRQFTLTADATLTITLSNENLALTATYPCDPCVSVEIGLPRQADARLDAHWNSGDSLIFGFSRAADYIYDDDVPLGLFRGVPGAGASAVEIPATWQAGAAAGRVWMQVGLPPGSRASGGFREAVRVTLSLSAVASGN